MVVCVVVQSHACLCPMPVSRLTMLLVQALQLQIHQPVGQCDGCVYSSVVANYN